MNTDNEAQEDDEGIDRRLLRRVQERFRAIGTARLARLRGMVDERQRNFLDLLPLLFHLNHPALPGYLSAGTPCGIGGYRADATTLALAHRQWRSFEARPGKASPEDITAVYLMGSSGTLGHADTSDLDLWICYRGALPQQALALLQRKAEAIGAWAKSEGVEAHLFLMNDDKFRSGEREPLTGENCGTAQHYLLLDEFYRTGILLAGRIPAWWLIPPEEEPRAQEWLAAALARRHVRATQLLDFGGLHTVPANEFVGAGIWQLYKAIDSPHKSMLKLLLFEIYAGEFPAALPLSADFKRAVYAGVTDIDELDPYLMVYRRIEAMLQHEIQPERLELARRCLYYKAGNRLSHTRGAEPGWQRLLMERLVADWGWDQAKLARLDARARWNIAEVSTERNALVKELVHSYRFLAEFARRSGAASAMDARELSVLGRKLHAAYERRAGKVDDLNAGLMAQVAEPELSLCARRDAAGEPLWGVWQGLVKPRGHPAGTLLRQAASLGELLAWCLLNRVIDDRTRITLREAEDGLSYAELEILLREIRGLLLQERPAPAEDAFTRQARAVGVLVLVNVATGNTPGEAGLQRVSSRSDALAYSALRENLVTNLEILHCNTWGEVVATRYTGEEGLLRCLREFPGLGVAPSLEPSVRVRCAGALHAASVESRVKEVLAAFTAALRGSADARYVLAVRGHLHLLSREDGIVSARDVGTEEQLLAWLGRPRRNWSALAIDAHALPGSPLPLVVEVMAPESVSVFWERQPQGLRILVADERGSLLAWTARGAREASTLAALALFLRSVQHRQLAAGAAGTQSPVFHALRRKPGTAGWTAERSRDPAPPGNMALHVQALAGHDGDWTVYCEGTAFAQRELGESFTAQLSSHIRSLRRGRGEYPVYITDLDLSALEPGSALQTVEYLTRRLQLEQQLNAALLP